MITMTRGGDGGGDGDGKHDFTIQFMEEQIKMMKEKYKKWKTEEQI